MVMGRMDRVNRSGARSWSGIVGVVLLTIAAACSPKPPDERDYATRIAAERAAKDPNFARSDDPIPTAPHAQFLPLAYFPIDPDYNVPGTLEPINDKTVYEMP